MLTVAIRPSRLSHEIIERTGEFVVNLPSTAIAHATDYAGVVSGRKVDKFAATGLTPLAGEAVSCPGIAECPINLECRAERWIPLGSHSLIVGRIVCVRVTADLVDAKGRLRIEDSGILAYAHGFYFTLGKRLGHHGWSVRKK